jgi:hypothetical protein
MVKVALCLYIAGSLFFVGGSVLMLIDHLRK